MADTEVENPPVEEQQQSEGPNLNEAVEEAKKAPPRATTVKDVPSSDFVQTYSSYLKRAGKVELPKTIDTMKTGPHKELAPLDQDWFYTRLASIARKLYIKPGQGVGELRRTYGGRKRRGSKPSHRGKASAGPLRKALQQLEKLGVVEKDGQGGRRLTRKGRSEMDTQATQLGVSA